MYFALAVAIAMTFWGDRNVPVPCTPVPISGADARLPQIPFGNTGLTETARMGVIGCDILISTQSAYERSAEPAYYCAQVVHEVGHVAGLPHRDDGVMNARLEENAIWDCAHWKAFAKRHGMAIRRR